MIRKYSYIATPALCLCVVDNKDLDKVLKKGIAPTVRSITDLPGHEHKKIIYAVHLGDEEALDRLKKLTGLENGVVLKVAVPAYYACIQEQPETVSEMISFKENGMPHQNILFIPQKIKAKHIIDMQGSDQDAVSYADSDSEPEESPSDQESLELKTSLS